MTTAARKLIHRAALVTCFVGCSCSFVHGAGANTPVAPVAVFPIDVEAGAGIAQDRVNVFADYLDSVVITAGFQTIPRSQIQDQIVEQQKETYKSCYDEACQIELGKAVAAQKALGSSWRRFGDNCIFTVKLYDLRTSLTEFGDNASGACDESGLKAAIADVGRRLAARDHTGGFQAFRFDLDSGKNIKNPPTDKTGYLKFYAEAKGRPDQRIEVYINGELKGLVREKGFFQSELPVGRYEIILRAPGDLFQHDKISIEMSTNGLDLGKRILRPMFGTLIIEGDPDSVTAMINGEPRAVKGRWSLELRSGRYEVGIEAPGYLPREPEVFVLAPEQEKQIQYRLVRNAGTIRVTGSPEGADVVMDQRSVGTLPIDLRNIEIGDHVVEVHAPGHHAEKRVVRVERGEVAHLETTLTPKLARLKVEAVASVMGDESPMETELFINDKRVGTTPWKGELLAEVPHRIELRLGGERGPTQVVELPEGREQREVIQVPGSWAGAVSLLRVEVVPGPWEIRAGPSVLRTDAPNEVRPGHLTVDFLLDGKKVGESMLSISPNEEKHIRVLSRPRTDEEMASSLSAHRWRKWIALGATLAAGAVAGERFLQMSGAESERDAALGGLKGAESRPQYDALHAQVIDEELRRRDMQVMGWGFLAGAGALAVWAGIEWLFAGPEPGELSGEGVSPVGGAR